jgi:hypothetical protein
MKVRGITHVVVASLVTVLTISAAQGKEEAAPLRSDADVKKAIIADSISRYPGNCPCPYNAARNGSRCGKRSAYSRPGGYSPICYDTDVTNEMISAWRKKHQAGH